MSNDAGQVQPLVYRSKIESYNASNICPKQNLNCFERWQQLKEKEVLCYSNGNLSRIILRHFYKKKIKKIINQQSEEFIEKIAAN